MTCSSKRRRELLDKLEEKVSGILTQYAVYQAMKREALRIIGELREMEDDASEKGIPLMNISRKQRVGEILLRIIGDDFAGRLAMERIARRLRRQAKVDRLLAPWFRLRRFCRRIFGRKREG